MENGNVKDKIINMSYNKINEIQSQSKLKLKYDKPNGNSNKKNDNKSNKDSKDKNSEKSIKNHENLSYLNSTPGGEDSKELSDYYENEKIIKTLEKNNKIKESQKKIDEEQNDITKSFSFKDFKKPSKVFLDNDENTTYMFCVIQCLSNFKFMICYYLNNLNEIKNKLYKMPLSYALSRIIFHLNPYPQNNLQKSFSIANFHKAVSYKNPFFSGNSEKDPIDFIVFLLDFLHEEDRNEMGQKRNNNDTITSMDNSKLFNYLNYLKENEHSIIFNNFCWINRTLKICTKCNSKFFNYQKYFTFDLKLDFDDKNNDSINNNFHINNFINNNGNTIKNILQKQIKNKVTISAYCRDCKKKVEFIINKSIIYFPNAFIILMEKNNKNSQLIIDEEMELSNEEETIKYKLNGVIAYNKLKDIDSFNYIAYCLNSIDDIWYKYDDTVETINKDDFLFNNNNSECIPTPTILFYKKI